MSNKTASLNENQVGTRDAILDNIRGLFVLMFLTLHSFWTMDISYEIPLFFRHAETMDQVRIAWWGFNLIDLAPITFIFFMGYIIYSVFIRKYERLGKRAFHDHIVRYLAMNGLFLTAIFFKWRLTGNNDGWSFMCDVMTTALLLTPFLTRPFRESTVAKFIAGVALLVIYWLFREPLIQYLGAPKPHLGGGIGPCIGYTGIALLSAGLGDLMRKRPAYYFAGVAALYIAGLLCTRIFAPMENLVSTEGILLTGVWTYSVFWMVGGLSKVFIIFTILWAICKYLFKSRRIWGIATIGRNLLLYMLAALLIMGIQMVWIPQKPISIGLSVKYVLLIYAFCFALTVPLEKYNVTFKL